MDERATKLGLNEALYREVNERVAEVADPEYLVVEKHNPEAERVAVETDPRS